MSNVAGDVAASGHTIISLDVPVSSVNALARAISFRNKGKERLRGTRRWQGDSLLFETAHFHLVARSKHWGVPGKWLKKIRGWPTATARTSWSTSIISGPGHFIREFSVWDGRSEPIGFGPGVPHQPKGFRLARPVLLGA